MANLKDTLAYALADAIGFDIEYDDAAEHLKGDAIQHIQFGRMMAEIHPKIVDSALYPERHFILMKVSGNLYALATASMRRVRFILINQAKFDGDILTLLDVNMPGLEDIQKRLGSAFVQAWEHEGVAGFSPWKVAKATSKAVKA